MLVVRYVMHFSPTQFPERPAKQFFGGGIHASYQPLVVYGIKPLTHVRRHRFMRLQRTSQCILLVPTFGDVLDSEEDRKSTRLNSSHLVNSYAVFCLKKQT